MSRLVRKGSELELPYISLFHLLKAIEDAMETNGPAPLQLTDMVLDWIDHATSHSEIWHNCVKRWVTGKTLQPSGDAPYPPEFIQTNRKQSYVFENMAGTSTTRS